MSGALVPTGSGRGANRQWIVFFGLALAIVIADQLTKAWIVANFQKGVPTPVLGDSIRIWYIWNNGALFGLFSDQAMVFAALSLGVVALITWYHRHAMRTSGWFATLALGLLLGGAVGNLIDRIRLGYVVDFVDMGIGNWRFFNYNVADSAISVSLLLLIVMAFWPQRPTEAQSG
jgi:signal peptidase II